MSGWASAAASSSELSDASEVASSDSRSSSFAVDGGVAAGFCGAGVRVVVGGACFFIAGWQKNRVIDLLDGDGSACLLLHTAQQAHLVQVRLLERHWHRRVVAHVDFFEHWQQGPNARHCRLLLLLFKVCEAAALSLVRDLRPAAASK